MAEELQYSTGGDAKRKYDGESSPPPPISGRRTTGFSSQSPDAGGPVAPDAEIQAAKQKAQEIAARLFNNSNVDAKRTKVENGGGYDSSEARGFSSAPPGALSTYTNIILLFYMYIKLLNCVWIYLCLNYNIIVHVFCGFRCI